MVLSTGNRADRGHLGQREGQAEAAGGGEEHSPDQRGRATVLQTELEAGGDALPGGEEGEGHAEDGERGEVPLSRG